MIGEENWIGDEVNDIELLDFPAETLPVLVIHKEYVGKKICYLRNQSFMHGVSIKSSISPESITVAAKTGILIPARLTDLMLTPCIND